MTEKSLVEVVTSPNVARGRANTTAHATKAGGFVFVTGQVGRKPDQPGNTSQRAELGSVTEQTIQVMENIKEILAAAGTDLRHVCKRNMFMTHAGDFEEVHRVVEQYLGPMASTCVVTGLLPSSARIEIEVIAVLPETAARGTTSSHGQVA
jgi:2-iminobutanoate/2-iminopropanoate deaminase